MPILKREPDFFPESLFDLDVEDVPWWVAHVRARQEKALARFLKPLEIPFYLPLHERMLRRAGRKFLSFLPLFPGYVFFRGTVDERYLAVQNHYVCRVLGVLDQHGFHAELGQLRSLQEIGASLEPHEYLGPGMAVTIAEGPFQGYSGVIVRAKGKVRMVVSVTMLRRSIVVELDREEMVVVPAKSRPCGREARPAA